MGTAGTYQTAQNAVSCANEMLWRPWRPPIRSDRGVGAWKRIIYRIRSGYVAADCRRYGVIAVLARFNAMFIEPDLNTWRQVAAATDFGDFGLKSRGFTCAILYFMLSLPVRPSASVCRTFLPLPASVFLSISLPSADNCHVILSRDIPSQGPNVGRCGLGVVFASKYTLRFHIGNKTLA